MRWSDATYPGSAWFLAVVDETIVGVATVGRMYVHPPEYPDLWESIVVDQHRDIGASVMPCSSRSRARAGPPARRGSTCGRPRRAPRASLSSSTAASWSWNGPNAGSLDLAGMWMRRTGSRRPPGIELTTLADRPELIDGVHAVALQAFPTSRAATTSIAAGDLAEFVGRDVERPGIRPMPSWSASTRDRRGGRATPA